MATYKAFEKQADGTLLELFCEGSFLGFDETSGDPLYGPAVIAFVGEPTPPETPLAPIMGNTSGMTARTSAYVQWESPDNARRPPLTEYRVYRDGVYVHTTPHTTGAFPAFYSWTETGLPTATPERIFRYTVRAVNADGIGEESNSIDLQWQGVSILAPSAPTTLTRTGLVGNQVTLHWVETADATVDKHGVYLNDTLLKDSVGAGLSSLAQYTLTGLTPETTYTGLNVRRHNSAGWSPASNKITFTTPAIASGFTMLMGTSVPESGKATQFTPLNGGYTQWDAVRTYSFGNAISDYNQHNPKVICLTDAGTGLQSGASGATALRSCLIDFYEGTGVTAARKAVEIHFANGNEYGADVTNQAAFADTVQRMYAVVHETLADGSRRFPNAKMGLDPTHNQEKIGEIAPSLMPVAKWLDFCAWSMYPPGRDKPTATNPTFTKPVLTATATGGHLERCFQRTVAARDQARTDTGDSTRDILMECWEVGIGNDPNDRDHRPYYAAHSIAQWIYERAIELGITFPVCLWWNQQVKDDPDGTIHPKNVLSDEPSTTSPSTATAWRTWKALVPAYGGTKPTNWPDAPKSTWPTGA